MSVPEAPMYEDDFSSRRECKIRFPRQALIMQSKSKSKSMDK